MMHAWLSDIRLYRRLISMQIRAQMQYKVNLVIDILTSLGVTCLEFVALLMFFIPFPTLLGWHMGDVALLASIITISFGLAELVGAGVDDFPWTIRRGEFDRVLLRPVGAFMQVIGSNFLLRRFGRITQGLLAFAVALHFLPGLVWTLLKVIVLLAGVVSGAIIFVSILLLGATLCFWTVETTELTSLLYYGGREMMSYPLTIYHSILQRVFLFVIPIAFGSYVPTCYILERSLPFGLPSELAFAAPLIALIFAFAAGAIWTFGIHRYQSTGS